MGIQERRLREKLRRKKEIIEAAESVIFEKGIGKATMRDIAKQAELGKATLYGYYKSKDEILLEISERAHTILAALFHKAIATPKTGYDKIQAIGRAYFEFAANYPNYLNFILLLEHKHLSISDLSIVKKEIPADQILRKVIRTGIEDGTLREDLEPVIVAKVLWGMATGILQILKTKGEIFQARHGITKENMIDNFFLIMERGLKSFKSEK